MGIGHARADTCSVLGQRLLNLRRVRLEDATVQPDGSTSHPARPQLATCLLRQARAAELRLQLRKRAEVRLTRQKPCVGTSMEWTAHRWIESQQGQEWQARREQEQQEQQQE